MGMKRASFYEGKPLTGRPITPVAQGKIDCGPDGKGGDAGAGALHGSEADPWTAGDAAQRNIFLKNGFRHAFRCSEYCIPNADTEDLQSSTVGNRVKS